MQQGGVRQMTRKPYGMICPITRACEILEPRWTIPILVALWCGATKFNDLRREIGSISPALLSKRLKELEELGLVQRIADPATGSVDYLRTDMAEALDPALTAIARWAQCNVDADTALCTVSASNLMWNIRKAFDVDALPKRRVVMQFRFSDKGLPFGIYWALLQPHAPVEICTSIPGLEIDLFVETNVTSLTGIVLGRTTVAREIGLGELYLSGDPVLSRTMTRWLKPCEYAEFDGIEMLSDRREGAAFDRKALPQKAFSGRDMSVAGRP
jgi:DNA-binding HxlR family transcriptional regulator